MSTNEPLMEKIDYPDFIAAQVNKKSNEKLEDQQAAEASNMARNLGSKAPNDKKSNHSNSMWFRAAGDNPFEKKDDDAKDDSKKDDKKEDKKDDDKKSPFPPKKKEPSEKKDDSKKPPFPPKKDDKKPAPDKKDGPGSEADDLATAEEAKELLLELKKMEGLEGEDHKSLDEAIKMLEKFMGEEKGEEKGVPPPMAPKAPGAPGMKPMKMDIVPLNAPKGPAAKPGMPPMAPKPPMAPHASAWVIENTTGYRLGDRVWPVESIGSLGHVNDEPGRIISIAKDNMLIVDWGDELPTAVSPSDVIAVKDVAGEDDMFSDNNFSEASNESGLDASSIPADLFSKEEAEAVLSKLSLKDMLGATAEEAADSIVHIASGKAGTFISTGSDGRCLVSFDGNKILMWPNEFKTKSS